MRVSESPAETAGWEAELALDFEARAGRSVIARRHHRGPFAVQKPFYPEGGVCHVYLLHPPGGVVGGDRLSLEIAVSAGAHALITTPAATKVYRSGGLPTLQEQRLSVRGEAALEWLPQETILYAHCRAVSATHVTLERGARFIGWELSCLGRPAADERFDAGSCRQRLEIWREGMPLLIERTRLAGGDALLQRSFGLMGRTVLGTLAAVPADRTMLEAVREDVTAEREGIFSATLLDEVLVCRYLGDRAEAARHRFASAWSAIRPRLLGRPACPPRIWRT